MTDASYNLFIRVGKYQTVEPIEYWDEINIKNDVVLALFVKAYIEKLLDKGHVIEEPIQLTYENMDTNERRSFDYTLREVEALTKPS